MNTFNQGGNGQKKTKNPIKNMAMVVSATLALGGSPVDELKAMSTSKYTAERVTSVIDFFPTAPRPRALVFNQNPTTPVQTEIKETTQNKEGIQSAIVGKDVTSVTGFMLENFGTNQNWDLLVDAGEPGLRGGDRVRNPNRDLIKGHRYFLARSEKEAIALSKILREKALKKRAETKQEDTTKTVIKKKTTKKTKNYTVTRPHLSIEENTFLTEISQKKSYIDRGEMYHFRTPETELRSLANKVGLEVNHVPMVKLLMSHIAKRESGLNYGAFGSTIKHKSIHRGHRAIGLTQIMPMNWIRWSEENFGTILDTSDTNQEKLGFVQIAKYYNQKKGQPLEKVAKHLAISWYGSTTVNGLPSPTEYAQGFIGSVLSDKENVVAAKKNIAANTTDTTIFESTPIDTTSTTTTTTQAKVTQVIESDVVAANDSYFKTPIIETGLAKVVSLQNYLLKSNADKDQKIGQRLVAIHKNMDTQNTILAQMEPQNTSGIIHTQIQLGEQMKQALGTAAQLAPNHPITKPILLALKETNSTVIQLRNAQERLKARREQELKKEQIARVESIFSREEYIRKNLGLAA